MKNSIYKKRSLTAIFILFGLTPLLGQHSFNELSNAYTEDFNNYRGTVGTLPNNMSVVWDETRTPEPFQGVNTGALTAYTSDALDHSFGIRERNPVDFRDGRLFFEFTNNTGVAITGFEVSYDVEAWFIGDRRNRIRMKYDTFLTPAETAVDPLDQRATFETDIFSTDNPSTTLIANTNVNGSLAANRTTVSGFVNLLTLDDGTGSPFGTLGDGETAYLRWQFSNAGGDGGTLRSGLAINNLSVTAIPEPSTYGAIFGAIAMVGAFLRRRARH